MREIRSASIQWLKSPGGVLRVHPENGVFGDKYSWCCTVEPFDDLAMLHGTMAAPTTAEFIAIFDVLRLAGYKRVRWVRIDGRVKDWNL